MKSVPKKLYFLVLWIFIDAATYAQKIIIRDIDIIPMTSNTLMKNQSVLLQDGKIRQIGKYGEIRSDKNTIVINGKGKFLMPGLADMHVHLPEKEKVDTLLMMNIAAGVTHIRVMNSETPQQELRKKIESDARIISPKIHISHIIRGDETYTGSQADSLMISLKNRKIDFIKVFGLSNESTFENLVKSSDKYGITLCGHYPSYRQENKTVMIDIGKVMKSNFKSIEHLSGYSWLDNEEQLNKAVRLTKENTIYNCPTLDWDIMAYDLQYPEEYKSRVTYRLLPSKYIQNWENDYKAAIEKAGGKDKVIAGKNKYKQEFEKKRQILLLLYKSGCRLLIGGDAGNYFQAYGFNVYEEMMNWSKAGIDNYTILKSATVMPALFFNEAGRWGTIEVGKDADILILEKNPVENIENISTITTTIINGQVFGRKELLEKL